MVGKPLAAADKSHNFKDIIISKGGRGMVGAADNPAVALYRDTHSGNRQVVEQARHGQPRRNQCRLAIEDHRDGWFCHGCGLLGRFSSERRVLWGHGQPPAVANNRPTMAQNSGASLP